MLSTACVSLASAAVPRPTCEQLNGSQRWPPSATIRSPRPSPAHTLPDGAATEAPLQPTHYVTADVSDQQVLNNAVEHRRRTSRTRHQHAPLPPAVDWLLSSPLLERPEGTGKLEDPKNFLRVMEAFWAAQKEAYAHPAAAPKPPAVISRQPGSCGSTPEFDLVVAGGTLGVLVALALQRAGHRVAIVERRLLQGRNQEWNIGRSELEQLVACDLLTRAELDSCVVSQWPSVRVGFHGGAPIDCGGDILDCGVHPRRLLAILRQHFLEAGGTLLEHTSFKSATVYDDGVAVQLLPAAVAAPRMEAGDVNRPMALQQAAREQQQGTGSTAHRTAACSSSSSGSIAAAASSPSPPAQRRRQLTTRLLVDCMGHYSPIVKQSRAGQQPDGMLLVVGGCFEGVPPEHNTTADLLATVCDAADDQQLFFEAFPAADSPSSRTVYMFEYTDCHPSRPSFATLLDTLCRLLPAYQGVPLAVLQPRRILLGGFPCYRRSPLRPAWDRVLHIGDAGAGQSPLSFGGFGSMVRHLPRLIAGVSEALSEERLSQGDLASLAPYQPSLSAAWLLQRAMAPRVGQMAAPVPATPAIVPEQGTHSSSSGGGSSSGSADAGGWLPADHVNRLLRCNFAVLSWLGAWAMRPFLKDTLSLAPLALTMLGMSFRDPVCVARTMLQLGPSLLAGWVRDFAALALFTVAHAMLAPLGRLVPPLARSWRFRRLLDALKWGAGRDYHGPHAVPAAPVLSAAGEPAVQVPATVVAATAP